LDGVHLGTAFAEVHFILEAGEGRRVAVGIEAVVQLENDAQRVHGVRKGLEMPRGLAEKGAACGDLQVERSDLAEFADVGCEFEYLAGFERSGIRSRLRFSVCRFRKFPVWRGSRRLRRLRG